MSLSAKHIAVATLAALAAMPAARAQGAGVERLAWLSGCWRSEGAEAGSGEQWLEPAGGTMLGISRTVRRGATVAHEFMQIRDRGDGQLAFFAQPSGKTETVFTLLPGAANEAVFENPEHDFPQRVIYRLEAGGRLQARIEGQRDGKARAVDFPMTRAACDAQPPGMGVFQGLPWGAGEAQIGLRFGAQLVRADCNAATGGALRVGEACDHPVLPRYEVSGIPFRLALYLDAQARELVRVALAHGVEGDAAEQSWSDKHRVLRQLLTQRYGSPESTHVDSEGGAQQALARWRRGETVIELSSSFLPRRGSTPARARVEVVYLPVTAGEAGKL